MMYHAVFHVIIMWLVNLGITVYIKGFGALVRFPLLHKDLVAGYFHLRVVGFPHLCW